MIKSRPDSGSFSSMKSSMFSGFSSASALASSTANSGLTVASNLASKASSKIITPTKSKDGGSKADEEVNRSIQEIGLNSSSRLRERDNLYMVFDTVSVEQADNVRGVSLELFVKTLIPLKFSTQWSDAAFRALDESRKGYLNKGEFLLGVVSLKTNTANMENGAWLKNRKKVVFAYYNRSSVSPNSLSIDDFTELLNDMSGCTTAPEAFGVSNKQWKLNHLENTKLPSAAGKTMRLSF